MFGMHATLPPGLLPSGREPGSPLDAAGAWRRRPLFWLALAFAAGIVLDDTLAPSLPALGGLLLSVFLAVPAVLVLLRDARWQPRARFALALLAGIAGGAFVHAQHARFLSATDITRRTPEGAALAWCEGTVIEVRKATPGSPGRDRWTLDLTALGGRREELAPVRGRVQLAIKPGTATVREGERLRFLARLESPATATLPSAFDQAGYLARQEIRRVGEPAAESLERLGLAPWWRADLYLRRFSGHLAERNDARLDAGRAGLLNALLLGRRDGLTQDDSEAFARTGTAHLLAISGLHVQAICALVAWLLLRLGLSKRRAALSVLLFAAAFACFSGAQPPVVRSALMIAIYTGAFVFFRAPDPLTTLGASALVNLLAAPGDLFLPGFQLSYLAVLALVTLYPTLETAWLVWRGFPEAWVVDPGEKPRLAWERRIRRACFVSLAAWAGTAPAVAWHMGNFTLPSLFTNLAAVPLSMLGMLCGALGMLPGLGFAATALNAPFEVLLGLNRWIGGFAWASLDIPAPVMPVLAVYATVLAWAWLGRAASATLPRLALMLGLAFFALASGIFFQPPPAAPRLTVFDLSRGRAALLETPGGEAALIDCGDESQGRRLTDTLRRGGIRSLALLVITQDDPDALGGAKELLARVDVRRAVLPQAAAPSAALRALEADLARHGVPYGPADPQSGLRGPGDVRWAFGTDAPDSGLPGTGSEALAVRVALRETSVLFVQARSSESLRRLLSRHSSLMDARILRLLPGTGGHWPHETAQLAALCSPRVIVAGQGAQLPGDSTGLDLEGWCEARGLRLLAPQRDGSLRLGERGYAEVEAFRAGRWTALP